MAMNGLVVADAKLSSVEDDRNITVRQGDNCDAQKNFILSQVHFLFFLKPLQ